MYSREEVSGFESIERPFFWGEYQQEWLTELDEQMHREVAKTVFSGIEEEEKELLTISPEEKSTMYKAKPGEKESVIEEGYYNIIEWKSSNIIERL